MKPIIAITTYGRFEKQLANIYYDDYFVLPTPYVQAVRRAGGIPLLLVPGESEEDWESTLAAVDGIIISGGGDIHPDEYAGNAQHKEVAVIDRERDKSELTLVNQLVNGQNMPALFICRGLQVLNVALGGTLHEHVADIHPEDIHRQMPEGWRPQSVAVERSSLLAEVMQATDVMVYSSHHQAIKELAPALRVSATATDGIIEAVEHTTIPWLIGVQWHPEATAATDAIQQRLFDGLVQEAAKRKAEN